MSQDHRTPSADESPIPTRWKRELFYALAWLPPLGILAFVMPMFSPIFEKLHEKEMLPKLSEWVLGFASFSGEYYHLPTVFVFVMLRALAEYFVIVSRRFQYRDLCYHVWCFSVICTGLLLWYVFCTASLSPVFKMSKVVVE